MLVDAETLASMLAGVAHVAVLSSEASWGLTHTLGKPYSVYQGAVRCYAAVFSVNDDVRQHRLWLAESILRSSSDKHRFINQCLTYCFAQVTSTFESFPLLNPRAIKARAAIVQPLAAAEIVTAQPEKAAAVEAIVERPAAKAEQILESAERVLELEPLVSKLESELQEVRSQNAELAKKFEEEQSFRILFEEENQRLTERIGVLTGASLDQSQPGAAFLKALGDAAVAAQVFVEDYKQLRVIANTVDAIRAEVDQLGDDNFDLKARIALFEQQREAETEQRDQVVVLGDPDTLQGFFVAKEPDHFELTNKGKKTFKNYPYLDQERLNAGLHVLRDTYIPMRLAEEDSERDRLYREFQERVASLRLTYGKTATEVGRGMAPEDHSIKIGTRTLELYKLRDLTGDFNWQHFFCVYFTWDEERKKLVINAFGHGDSPSSHT